MTNEKNSPQKNHSDPDGTSPCAWTGLAGNGLWSDAENWESGRLPERDEVVRITRFSGPRTIEIAEPTTIGRLEVELESLDDEIVITGSGPLVLSGVDRLRGKPTTLQVMAGTLEFRHPLRVEIEGPRFSAYPGGHLKLGSSLVYATVHDLKLAMSQTGRMTLAVPYWEPNMDWDIATSRTLGLGDRELHYDHAAHQGPMGLTFNKFKEHDGDVIRITGFREGDYLRFNADPRLSTDPGKHLCLEGIRFPGWPNNGAAGIAEKDGYWYFLPDGIAIPDTGVHRSLQDEARKLIPQIAYPEVRITSPDTFTLAPATDRYTRNMGGDLVRLEDGRLLLAYSQWVTGATDEDSSRVVGRISDDDGKTWGEVFPVAEPDESRDTVRMPSFVRLGDGRLAVFVRCHQTMAEKWVVMMICRDEKAAIPNAAMWTDPVRVTPSPPGRHVIIASRVIRTNSGRLIVPIAPPWPWRRSDKKTVDIRTTLMLSDDDGRSWRQSRTTLKGPGRGLMEPTVVELPSGRLMMLMRTQTHRQYVSYSEDGGETWTKATEVTRLISPESPAAIAMEPNTGWTMVVWNRNSNLGTGRENRTPLTVGFSSDEGDSWFGFHNLEQEPGKTWFYPTLRFLDGTAHVIYSERTETDTGDTRIALKMKTFRVEEGT